MNKSQVSLHKQQNNMVIMHMFTIAIPDLNPQPHKHIVKVTRYTLLLMGVFYARNREHRLSLIPPCLTHSPHDILSPRKSYENSTNAYPRPGGHQG